MNFQRVLDRLWCQYAATAIMITRSAIEIEMIMIMFRFLELSLDEDGGDPGGG